MLSKFELVYKNLLQSLTKISGSEAPALLRSEEAISAVEKAIQELKQTLSIYNFADVPEEIAFYKDTLPFFQSLFIYYANVFRVERTMPAYDKEDKIKFLRKEQKKLGDFLMDHKDFVTYYELGKSYQDILYFTKQYDTEQRWQLLDIYAYGVDEAYCTRYSLLLSTILAYRKLHKYLQDLIEPELVKTGSISLAAEDDMAWQGSITSLGELIIGLYASRVFKNPKLPLAKVSRYMCRMFGIEQINIHKVKEELRMRKKGRTPFLDTTRMNLLRFWDEEDLNAL